MSFDRRLNFAPEARDGETLSVSPTGQRVNSLNIEGRDGFS
jgi:hypothetical protein